MREKFSAVLRGQYNFASRKMRCHVTAETLPVWSVARIDGAMLCAETARMVRPKEKANEHAIPQPVRSWPLERRREESFCRLLYAPQQGRREFALTLEGAADHEKRPGGKASSRTPIRYRLNGSFRQKRRRGRPAERINDRSGTRQFNHAPHSNTEAL